MFQIEHFVRTLRALTCSRNLQRTLLWTYMVFHLHVLRALLVPIIFQCLHHYSEIIYIFFWFLALPLSADPFIFGKWEETREHGENLHWHRDDIWILHTDGNPRSGSRMGSWSSETAVLQNYRIQKPNRIGSNRTKQEMIQRWLISYSHCTWPRLFHGSRLFRWCRSCFRFDFRSSPSSVRSIEL